MPALDTNPAESCLLAVSPDQVGHIAASLLEDARQYADGGRSYSPWWVRSASYFGAEAKSVGLDDLFDKERIIKPGTAGHSTTAWWASSLCNGKPALHTLSAAHIYDHLLDDRTLTTLFHAYVADITERRGCTHVTYPD
jgi:hypothetical protein